MLRKNIRELLKSNSDNSKITISLFNKDEGLIPTQLSDLDKEKKELELLRTQAQSGVNLNSFLANKYTDGNKFAIAQQNLYDNSKERIAAGISYEYHVFFPEDQYERAKRPPNSRIITNKIKHLETGDHYYYHFALCEFPVNKEMFYKIDLTEEIVTTQGVGIAPNGYPHNDNRLFYCLQNLSRTLVEKKPNIPEYDYIVLQDNGFITDEGKLILDVTTGVLVEKYFLKLDAKKKFNAMKYLNKEYKTEKEIEKVLQKDGTIDSTYPDEVPSVDGVPVIDTNLVKNDLEFDNLEKILDETPENTETVDTVNTPSVVDESKRQKKRKLEKYLTKLKLEDDKKNAEHPGAVFHRSTGIFLNPSEKKYNIDNLDEIFTDLEKEGYKIKFYEEKSGNNDFIYPIVIPFAKKRIAVLYLKNTYMPGGNRLVIAALTKKCIGLFVNGINRGVVTITLTTSSSIARIKDLGFENIMKYTDDSTKSTNPNIKSNIISIISRKTE